MPFLLPDQQRQSTEGKTSGHKVEQVGHKRYFNLSRDCVVRLQVSDCDDVGDKRIETDQLRVVTSCRQLSAVTYLLPL